MQNDGQWIGWERGDCERYRLHFGPRLRFAVVHDLRSDAQRLWTVGLNDRGTLSTQDLVSNAAGGAQVSNVRH